MARHDARMELGLAGKACIVTGASRGIGLATARMLCEEGARVLLTARGEEALGRAVESCGGEADGLVLDVTAADAGDRAAAACEERFGALDVLVNNAGTSRMASLDELTDDDWYEQWELSVMGPMRLMRAAAPRMAARGGGRIVNVCSSSGKRPSGSMGAYSVAKAAQLSLSRLYADALAGDGVLVNAVAPGPVQTPLWMNEGGLADQAAAAKGVSREELLADRAKGIPVGRMGTEDEIAAVVVFLCSERASYVAGAAWSVDGGSVATIV
jgi:3-oxoacyl-[acyl-carrier protein] reductase